LRVAATARPWRTQILHLNAGGGFLPRARMDSPARIGRLVEAASPGRSGLIDRTGTLRVQLGAGALQSVTTVDMLGGANAAALECASGQWEVFQFASADEIQPGIWKLSQLLRGQLGTEDSLAAGADVGARFVLLDGTVVPAGLRSGEIGRELDWRCGPVGYDLSDRYATSLMQAGGIRALLPLSPVHLRGRLKSGGFEFAWTRRGRIDADSWLANEIPLGEDEERYAAQLNDADGVFASAELAEPRWEVPTAEIAGRGEIVLQVSQMSRAVGSGIPASRTFKLNN